MRMPARRISRRSRRSPLRVIGIVVLVIVAVVVIAGVAAVEFINPNAYKPEIEAAVQRATGRKLTLAGPITIVSYTRPTIAVANVAFANMPGGTRPEMLSVRSITADIGWRALLSGQVRITRLVLDSPSLLLETNARGEGNWQFTPQAKPAKPAAAPAKPGAAPAFSIQTLHVRNATLTWHDGRTGRTTVVMIPRVSLTAGSLSSPVMVDAEVTALSRTMTLSGTIGPLERLFGGSGAPWPINLHAATTGAQIAVSGTIAEPRRLTGYALRVQADVVNTADLAALSPVALPSLHDLTLDTTLADRNGQLPSVQSLSLRMGRSDLAPVLPGVTVSEADIDAPAADKPIHVAVQGALDGAPLSVVANLGAPAALMGDVTGKASPFPIDVDLQAANAHLTAKGAIADPVHLRGTDVALAARIPDLSALSPLALRRLPALRDVTFAARLRDAGGNGGAIAVQGLSLAMPHLAISGALDVVPGAHPRVSGNLDLSRLDLDKLAAILNAPVPGQMPRTAPPAPSGPVHVFPTTPFDLAPLHLADFDLALRGGNVVTGGGTISAFAMHAALQNGDLNLTQGSADLPGGHITFTLGLDARPKAAKIALKITGPSLATAQVLGFMGVAPLIDGTAQLHVDVTGDGNSPHAVASTLGGTVGLAMAGGRFDSRMLGPTLDAALHIAGGQIGGANTSLRCLAVRLEVAHGVARVAPLLIDSDGFDVSGGGSVLLGEETLALLLRPRLRVGGADLGVPVSVTGPILAPKASPDGGAAVASLASMASSPVGDVKGIAGAVGQTLFGAGPAADPCPTALAQARFGLPGAAPPPQRSGVVPGVLNGAGQGVKGLQKDLQGPAGQILKGLFR